MLSLAVQYMILIPTAAVVGLALRFLNQQRLEQRAWGVQRSSLSREDRREIRRAVREGRPVGDRHLAVPAVMFGEQVESSSQKSSWLNNPSSRGWFIFGRIFFPMAGAFGIVSGITDHDGRLLFSGIVLAVCTVLYLPMSERWMRARRAQRDSRRQASVEANRLLANP